MPGKKADAIKILTALADYRLMSAAQLAIYFEINKEAIWKHFRKLCSASLIKEFHTETGRSRGRPESMYSLTDRGIEVLRKKEILNLDKNNKFVLAENLEFIQHQILQNWFRLHLVYANRKNTVFFENIPTNSSLYWEGNNYTNLYYRYESITSTSDGKEIRFLPDVIFRCYDKMSGRILLFFVEIDRGTESLMNPDRKHQGDIAGKIINYLYCWNSNSYKKYEQVWNCKFNGFRLLFVTNSTERCANLCRLVSDLGSSSNFAWITEVGALFNSGVGGHIWNPGGRRGESLESILGKLAFDCPIPEIKYQA